MMAKLLRGRIVVVRPRFSGFAGMDSQTAEELHTWADRMDRRSRYSDPADDPRWLSRRAKLLRRLAEQKEQALEHKERQHEARRTRDEKRGQVRMALPGTSKSLQGEPYALCCGES